MEYPSFEVGRMRHTQNRAGTHDEASVDRDDGVCEGPAAGTHRWSEHEREEKDMEPWVWVIIAVAAVLLLLLLFRRGGGRGGRTVVVRRPARRRRWI
jgi:hypothetical protein